MELRELSLSRQLVQEHSKYALVFESEGSYYKYSHCLRPTFATTVFRRPQTELAIFPSDTAIFFTKEFYIFDKQEKPLKPDQAKKRLNNLLKQAAAAIKGLHGAGVAHMDIRLENICFKRFIGGYHAVLIDLDECVSAYLDASEQVECANSYMYKPLTLIRGKACMIFDRLQLGWLTLWLRWGLEEEGVNYYHEMQWEMVPG